MIDLKDILGKKERQIPKHIAFTMNGSFAYAKHNRMPGEEVCRKDFDILKKMVELCADLKIPIMTFYAGSEKMKDSPNFPIRIDAYEEFFKALGDWPAIHERQIKVSVIGKWYNLPSRVVEPIKHIISRTKDYDSFFLNLCINYDGREEIVDACKMIARQVLADRIDPESITKESIKENLYSSYFMPPDLIIKTGKVPRLNGFLLWDSSSSRIHFSNKYWPEFSKDDLAKALQVMAELQSA